MIHDPLRLIETVLAEGTNTASSLHGPAHWRSVAWTGLQLIPDVPGCDADVVFLFALLHDSMRVDDGHDRGHGQRAAEFARLLHGRGLLRVRGEQLSTLAFACENHDAGRVSPDPTVGVCWDADRLNLWRINVRPDPKFLSTRPGKREDVIRKAAGLHGQRRDWGEIIDAYRGLGV